jgi:hypothetical protein
MNKGEFPLISCLSIRIPVNLMLLFSIDDIALTLIMHQIWHDAHDKIECFPPNQPPTR